MRNESGGADAGSSPALFRIRLLGSLRVFDPSGQALGVLQPGIEQRVLTLLAMRTGKACSIYDLVQAGWGWDNNSAQLPPQLARLRGDWRLNEISKRQRGESSHVLALPRTAIDALTFIDVAREPNPQRGRFDEVLGLWDDDPRSIHAETPDWVWTDLGDAVDKAVALINAMSDHERADLTNLSRFLDIVRPKSATPTLSPKRGRLLIVEDNPLMVETLRGVLYDFECVVADSPAAAMSYVLDESLELEGAIVDRHLSSSLDSAGLTVLACLRDTRSRSQVPRVLLTSDNPEGPDLEIKRTYGLFAIVTKGGSGAAAPGIREVVETMVADPRAQALARLDGEAATLARDLGRASASVRRAIRQQGTTTERDAQLRALEVLEDEFHEECQQLEQMTASLPDAKLIPTVDEFLSKWRANVDHGH